MSISGRSPAVPVSLAAERVRAVTSLSVMTLGGVVLVVGWALGVDTAKRVLPGLVTMKANTAIAITGAGMALWQIRSTGSGRWWGRLAALGVVIIGVTTLLEYWAGIRGSGFDQLLFKDHDALRTSRPGRPGANTAAVFVLMGTALLALLGPRPLGRLRSIVAHVAAVAAGAIALLGLLGYGIGVAGARGFGSATEMALHTAVAFLLLTVGLIAVLTEDGPFRVLLSTRPGGLVSRRLLGPTVVLVVAICLVVAWAEDVGVIATPDLSLATVGTVTALMFVALILTAALRVEEAAEREEQANREAEEAARDLEAMLSAFGDVYFRVMADGVVAAAHLAGAGPFPVGPLLGRRLSELVPLPARPDLQRALETAHVERSAETVEFESSIDGRRRTYQARILPAGGDALAVSVRDVSDLADVRRTLESFNRDLERLVEERTAEATFVAEELARSNRELEQFAYLASHDLQEPLRHVSAFVQKLADRYSDVVDDRGRTYIRFAVEGAERMRQLIEGLLEYSRVGQAPPQFHPVDLGAVVDAAVRSLSVALEEAGAVLTCDSSPPVVVGDEDLLYRLLVNLLSNAVKFRHPDRPPRISIETASTDGWCEVTIADNGVGIDPQYRDQVFEMFERLHGGEVPGTGIGLTVARRIVELHGGAIRVADNPEGGTRVAFTLPRVLENCQATD